MRVKYNLNYANGVAVCSNFSEIEQFLVDDGWHNKGNYYFKECSREQYEESLLKLNKIANTEPYRSTSFWIVSEGGTEPSKRSEDLGWDIYAADIKSLDKDDEFLKYVEDGYLVLQPGEIVNVPTHIRSAVSREWGFLVKERGSTGSIGLSVRCGVIDSGFKGEWRIFLNNTSNKEIRYPLNKAIAQAVIVYNYGNISYYKWESKRGESMLGSSGK